MGRIKTIDLIYTISFLDLFSVALIFPVFGNYIRDLGASHTTVGLLTSSYAAIQVLSGPLIGSWSDVRDRRTVLKITLLLCSICYGLLGTTHSIGFIFILRLLLGIVKHTQSICKAVITDLLPPEKQSESFAKSASVASIGFMIGPFVGGNLAELPNGFTYVCFLTAGLFILNYILTCFLPESMMPKEANSKTTNDTAWFTVKHEMKKSITEIKEVDWAQHWDHFLLKFLLGLSMSCYFSNQSLYLKETYQLSSKHRGYMISFFSFVGIVSGLVLEKIDQILNIDLYTSMCLWYGVLSLGFIGLYLSPSLIIFILWLIPLSLAGTAMRVTTMDMMFRKSKAIHKGSLSGASNSVMSVARFMTPLITGITSDIFNEQSVMLIAVVPASLGLVVSVFMKRKQHQIAKNK